MSAANRVYFKEGDTWTVDGVTHVGRIQNGSIQMDVEVKEHRAITDPGQYPVAGVKSASIEWTEAVEGASSLLPGSVVNFSSVVSGGDTFTGTFLVTGRGNQTPEGGQQTRPWTGQFRTLTVNGTLYF
jgi:hypothetical protein